jgi:hypothetical protein
MPVETNPTMGNWIIKLYNYYFTVFLRLAMEIKPFGENGSAINSC